MSASEGFNAAGTNTLQAGVGRSQGEHGSSLNSEDPGMPRGSNSDHLDPNNIHLNAVPKQTFTRGVKEFFVYELDKLSDLGHRVLDPLKVVPRALTHPFGWNSL